MLRVGQKLIKYGYNGSSVPKFTGRYSPEVEKKEFKSSFKPGDAPEYIYDAKIKFNEDYKPYTINGSHTILFSVVALFSYLTYRYERVRELDGKTLTHQYPV